MVSAEMSRLRIILPCGIVRADLALCQSGAVGASLEHLPHRGARRSAPGELGKLSGGNMSHGLGGTLNFNRPLCGEGRAVMLETIAIVLVVLWVLGLVSSYTMGGFIHALLVIAIVVILIRVIQGRRV